MHKEWHMSWRVVASLRLKVCWIFHQRHFVVMRAHLDRMRWQIRHSIARGLKICSTFILMINNCIKATNNRPSVMNQTQQSGPRWVYSSWSSRGLFHFFKGNNARCMYVYLSVSFKVHSNKRNHMSVCVPWEWCVCVCVCVCGCIHCLLFELTVSVEEGGGRGHWKEPSRQRNDHMERSCRGTARSDWQTDSPPTGCEPFQSTSRDGTASKGQEGIICHDYSR